MSRGIIYADENLKNSFLIDEYYIEHIKELLLPYPGFGELPLDREIEKDLSYLNLYKDCLRSFPLEKRFDIVERTDSGSFIENIRTFYRVMGDQYSREEAITFFRDNPFLFEYDLQNIFSNYEYLKDCSYFSNDTLNFIYLGNYKTIQDKVFSMIHSREKIPNRYIQLSVSPEKENLLSLDRNLKFIVSMYGLRSVGDLSPVALQSFDYGLFENKVRYDDAVSNSLFSRFINFSQYEKYFKGVKQDTIECISKLSPHLIDEFNELFDFSDYRYFIEHMDTVRKWNTYIDPMKRACDFRDEFVTRTMFGCLFQAGIDYHKTHPDEKLNSIMKLVMSGKVPLHLNEDALKIMSGSTIRDVCSNRREAVMKAEKFVSNSKGNIKREIYKAYRNASKMFEEENTYWSIGDENGDVNRINNNLALLFMDDPYFQLGSFQKRERFVDEMYESMRKYSTLSNKEKDNCLKNRFQTIHYYMVNNEEYTIQNENQARDEKKDVRTLARKLFAGAGGKYNIMDRLFYSSYNSNRLAHSTTDILRKIPIRDNYLFRKDGSSYVERLMSNYNTLHQYGFSVDYLNEQLDLHLQKNQQSIFDKLTLDNNQILSYIHQFVPLSDQCLYTIQVDNISKVVETLKDVQKQNSDDRIEMIESNRRIRDEFSIFAKEENMFFDLKRFFIEEAENRISKRIGKDVSMMTADEKIKLLESDGYFMEYQMDDARTENNVTIVVYDKKFNAPFSIHYLGNKELDLDFIRDNQLVHHTFNHNGLTEKTDYKRIKVSDSVALDSMFLSDTSVGLNSLRDAADTSNLFHISLVHHSNDNKPDVLMDKLDEMSHLSHLPIEILEEDENADSSGSSHVNRGRQLRDDILSRYHLSRLFLLGDIYSNKDVKVEPLRQTNLFDQENKLTYNGRSVIITDREKKFLESQFPDIQKSSDNDSNGGPKL